MIPPAGPDSSAGVPALDGGRPRLVGRVGSLDAFWPLLEPVLDALRPRRLCEVGVDQGIFTDRLLSWAANNGCAYVGIDPAPDLAVAERVRRGHPGANELLIAPSLDALPTLVPCDVYFLDGDHNYHTVRHELDLIARASAACAGPVIFAHDVGWPWARRDMYHRPEVIPPAGRHPSSDELGVSLDGDELVPGGLRSPGRYAIALHAGGPRNGVLTAIEDFLASNTGQGWKSLVVPIAYGLGVLYRRDAVPEACRAVLERLATGVGSMPGFFESCEANFLRTYLYAEDARAQLDYLTGKSTDGRSTYQQLEEAYRALEGAYRALEGNYKDLSAHSEALLAQFNGLLGAYKELDAAFRRTVEERDALQRRTGADGGANT